jgi:hypothetical protein
MFGRRKKQNGNGSETIASPTCVATSSDRTTEIIGFDIDESADHASQTERPAREKEASQVDAVDSQAVERESHDEEGKVRPNGVNESAPPTPEALARHIAEIRRMLPPERSKDAIDVLTRQYNRARRAHGLPPVLPSGS